MTSNKERKVNGDVVQGFLRGLRIGGSQPEDRQDISQECLLAIWQAEQRHRQEPDSLSDKFRWVICSNAARSWIRKNKRHLNVPGIREFVSFDLAAHDCADESDTPQADAVCRESLVRLCNDEEEAAVALAVFVVGLTEREAATALDVSRSTLQRTVARLRDRATRREET